MPPENSSRPFYEWFIIVVLPLIPLLEFLAWKASGCFGYPGNFGLSYFCGFNGVFGMAITIFFELAGPFYILFKDTLNPNSSGTRLWLLIAGALIISLGVPSLLWVLFIR